MSNDNTRALKPVNGSLDGPLGDARQLARCDVVVVGAGPVGLTMACKLAQHGLSVACVEASRDLCTFPRAVGMDDEVLRCFVSVGIPKSTLDPCLMNCAGIKYYGEHNQLLAIIHPKHTPYGYFKGATFYQPFLERVLLERALELGVKVLFGAPVTDVKQNEEAVILTLEPEAGRREIAATYVVGADGSHSFLRKRLGIGFGGTTFEQKWLIVDTENDVRQDRYVESWCHSERPTVSIPRRNGYRRWEFMLKKSEKESRFRDMTHIWPLLKKHIDVSEIRIARHHVYTFHSRVADRYRDGRIFLAGDAAHVMPPFMAQGLASGIRDAENLGWKLAGVIKGELKAEILDSYEEERKPHVLAMSKLSARAGAFVMPRGRLRSLLRDFVLRLLGKIPGIMPAIEEALMRPGPKYAKGLFMSAPFAGEMFPQPKVRSRAGDVALLDDYLGKGFSLICYGSVPSLEPSFVQEMRRLSIPCVQIVPQGLMVDARFGSLPGAAVVEDVHHTIGCFTRSGDTRLFLLRPDRYIMCSFVPSEAKQAGAWLRNRLLDFTHAQRSAAVQRRQPRAPEPRPSVPDTNAAE